MATSTQVIQSAQRVLAAIETLKRDVPALNEQIRHHEQHATGIPLSYLRALAGLYWLSDLHGDAHNGLYRVDEDPGYLLSLACDSYRIPTAFRLVRKEFLRHNPGTKHVLSEELWEKYLKGKDNGDVIEFEGASVMITGINYSVPDDDNVSAKTFKGLAVHAVPLYEISRIDFTR